ncbi:ABC transporter substrate-binding protein [Paenibacillus sanguinis]|uniref:ABC transporter substrate-binding protein n=1 Tax=Paenibacillus sanguinis TaxID=225906 RepID=UPI00035DFF1A|nr:ABC transporter substrate-binding protein [Paenibacillus sanguinis]
MKTMMFKVLTMLLLTAVFMAGCGTTTSDTSDKSGGNADSPSQAGDMKTILTQKPTGERIVLATNNASDGRDTWLKAKIEEAGFHAEIVPLGGGDITSRVISEASNPTLNVVWGPSDSMFESMVQADALEKWTPEWADKVAGVAEDNGYSWTYEIQPKLLVANPEVYTSDTVPTSYQDLWEKEMYHGKYAVPVDFGGTTNRAIIGGILGQYLDANGELGVSAEGWNAIKQYFAYGYKTPQGENDFQNMASGEVPITFTYASGLKGKMETFNVTPIIIYSATGEPSNANQIGVLKNSNQAKLEESIRLANWLGSAEVIGEYASQYGSMVVNKDATDQMIPLMQEVTKNFKAQQLDWDYVNSMMDEWVAKIQLEYM